MTFSVAEILNNPLFRISAFLGVLLLIASINAWILLRIHQFSPPEVGESLPKVSVLIPARDEEHNIRKCIASLLAQDYLDYEVIALDDHSQDRTGQILVELAACDGRLRILQGQPLPDGWLGKNWACHQLSEAAQGDIFLFVDADTTHHKQMLSQSVSALHAEKIDLLTALPKQEVRTWGEKLTVPILYWAMLCFIPLPLAYHLRAPIFSAAIGQFMLFRRTAYERVGGYAAVRQHGADDLALARQVKKFNLPWRLADGGQRVQTRMYQNFRQAFEGFSKNLFAAFDYHLLLFLFAWIWIGVVFYEPIIVLILKLAGAPIDPISNVFAVAAIAESLLLWGLVILRLRFPAYLALLYPVIAAISVAAALRSAWLSLRGRATWKGRTLGRPRIHWL
jgi:chlorobactene glucosyltransferase